MGACIFAAASANSGRSGVVVSRPSLVGSMFLTIDWHCEHRRPEPASAGLMGRLQSVQAGLAASGFIGITGWPVTRGATPPGISGNLSPKSLGQRISRGDYHTGSCPLQEFLQATKTW